MPIVKIVKGDLLTSDAQYIAQQCNCVTVKAHGLSLAIATKYPWANVYGRRSQASANTASQPSVPGTIEITTDGNTSIIHMFAQWTPGRVGSYSKYYPQTYQDTTANRITWFKECLKSLDTLQLPQVAMPYQIGCGLAGGHWPTYEDMLNTAQTNIVLYRPYLQKSRSVGSR